MKRFLLALCLFSITALTAQTSGTVNPNPPIDPKQVPAVVTQNFITRFPNVTPAWHNDGKNYRANYIDPDSKLGCVVVYDKDGNVVRTENEVDNSGYPSSIGDYYSDNYPGETFQVWSTDDKSGSKTLYYTSRNDETIWFDNEGKVVPSQKAKKTIKKETKKK